MLLTMRETVGWTMIVLMRVVRSDRIIYFLRSADIIQRWAETLVREREAQKMVPKFCLSKCNDGIALRDLCPLFYRV